MNLCVSLLSSLLCVGCMTARRGSLGGRLYTRGGLRLCADCGSPAPLHPSPLSSKTHLELLTQKETKRNLFAEGRDGERKSASEKTRGPENECERANARERARPGRMRREIEDEKRGRPWEREDERRAWERE